MIELERQLENDSSMFNKKFGRKGQLDIYVGPDSNIRPVESYQIIQLPESGLSDEDRKVRKEESLFAPQYDTVQFVTPGMAFMAQRDTALFEEWVGSYPKRALDVGAGTGRVTLPLADALGYKGKVYAIDTARPYLDRLAQKASAGEINPKSIKLGLGDIQSVNLPDLTSFTDGGRLDVVSIWFGPLALMIKDPQGTIKNLAALLKRGGSLVLTTNSLNGLGYTIPERAEEEMKPLGFVPSIYTRRVKNAQDKPIGMVLGAGNVLPARFYDQETLTPMLEEAGLEVVDVRGICRLTALYPANPDLRQMTGYLNALKGINPAVADLDFLEGLISREYFSQAWKEVVMEDLAGERDPDRIPQYNYLAIKAIKK